MTDFTAKILKWYAQYKRDLPWRKTRDPYKIWLSEIILQQTRVEQGRNYYLRFVEAFPRIKDLAESNEDMVLKLWQGLGYYSRARNLHATAKQVVDKYNGRFPTEYDALLVLKGIGPYTAAAIASIAFGRVVPVVDGNVIRVLARYHGIRETYGNAKQRKTFEDFAWQSISKEDPGAYNQAIMEFGALFCTPVNPDCNRCIFRKKCVAYNAGQVNQLPLRPVKIKVKKRYFNYMVIRLQHANATKIFFKKRDARDIWRNLYDFPLIESDSFMRPDELEDEFKKRTGEKLAFVKRSREFQHLLTHRKIKAQFFVFDLSEPPGSDNEYIKVDINNLEALPIPRLIEKYLQEEKFL